MVPMATKTTVVMRVDGLGAVTAALILKVVQRSVRRIRESIPLPAALLRSAGVACCAGTGRAAICGRLVQELGMIPEIPDPQVLRVIAQRLDRAASVTTAELSIAECLQALCAPATPAGAEPQPAAEPSAVAGPLERSMIAISTVSDGPSNPATFGEPRPC